MNFLENIALPQSFQQLELLSYLSLLTLIIMLPYLGLLFGSTLLSVMFNRKGKVYQNNIYIKFSKELIDLVTVNISSAFALGLLPLLSMAFILTQFMQGSGSDIGENMMFSVVLLFSAIISIYTFKGSFQLGSVDKLCSSNKWNDKSLSENFDFYKKNNLNLILRSGPIGLILLAVSIIIFISAFNFASNSSRWGSEVTFFQMLFTPENFIAFISFISISFVLTSILLLYKLFKPGSIHEKTSSDYSKYVKKFSLNTAIIFTLAQVILYAVGLMSVPKVAISNSLFFISIFIIFFLFILTVVLYYMIKDSHLKYRNNALFIMFILFFLVSLKEQIAFDTSSQLHNKVLNENYVAYKNSKLEKLGFSVETISGEEIFTGRCAACHSFETKIVGPPYNETLVKYEGNVDGLADFIYDPQKINPDYPPMPNQGLKPSEAKAVAEYIVNTYNEKYK
jgi:cytochrome c